MRRVSCELQPSIDWTGLTRCGPVLGPQNGAELLPGRDCGRLQRLDASYPRLEPAVVPREKKLCAPSVHSWAVRTAGSGSGSLTESKSGVFLHVLALSAHCYALGRPHGAVPLLRGAGGALYDAGAGSVLLRRSGARLKAKAHHNKSK